MKTRFYILILLPLMLLASCQQQIDSPVLPDNAFQLVAVQDPGDDTKTIISGETSVYWEPAEEIKVFKADGTGYLFKSSNTEPAATALFSGVLTTDDVTEGEELWSVYPFAEEATFDGESITTVLPSSQVARAESFGRNMNLSIARTTSRQLQFYNVGGGIRFSVTQEGISKVIFEGLNGEILSGKVTVGFENGRPVVKEVSGGSPFITLTPPDGETFQTGKWYFIVTIPGALSGGYKLRFYKADDYARRVSDTPVTIKRGIYGSRARADASIDYESTTTSFPETEEEIRESDQISLDVSIRVNEIFEQAGYQDMDSDDIDLEHITNSIRQVEGVMSAELNSEEKMITVVKKDGTTIWFDYADSDDEIPYSEDDQESLLSELHALMQNVPQNHSSSTSKKALLLSPFQSSYFVKGIQKGKFSVKEKKIRELLASYGYSLEFCPDDKASLDKFTGDYMSDYDLFGQIFFAT